jgi:hypothetical protein
MYELGMIDELIEDIEFKIKGIIGRCDMVRPEKLGLDNRAGWKLYVCKDGIIVSKDNDRTLQYYGGFEYIDKEDRVEIGKWVFYSSNSDRVAKCLDCFADETTS